MGVPEVTALAWVLKTTIAMLCGIHLFKFQHFFEFSKFCHKKSRLSKILKIFSNKLFKMADEFIEVRVSDQYTFRRCNGLFFE